MEFNKGELCSLPTVFFPRKIRGSTVGADGNYCTILLGNPLSNRSKDPDQYIPMIWTIFRCPALIRKSLGGKSYLYLFNVYLPN